METRVPVCAHMYALEMHTESRHTSHCIWRAESLKARASPDAGVATHDNLVLGKGDGVEDASPKNLCVFSLDASYVMFVNVSYCAL